MATFYYRNKSTKHKPGHFNVPIVASEICALNKEAMWLERGWRSSERRDDKDCQTKLLHGPPIIKDSHQESCNNSEYAEVNLSTFHDSRRDGRGPPEPYATTSLCVRRDTQEPGNSDDSCKKSTVSPASSDYTDHDPLISRSCHPSNLLLENPSQSLQYRDNLQMTHYPNSQHKCPTSCRCDSFSQQDTGTYNSSNSGNYADIDGQLLRQEAGFQKSHGFSFVSHPNLERYHGFTYKTNFSNPSIEMRQGYNCKNACQTTNHYSDSSVVGIREMRPNYREQRCGINICDLLPAPPEQPYSSCAEYRLRGDACGVNIHSNPLPFQRQDFTSRYSAQPPAIPSFPQLALYSNNEVKYKEIDEHDCVSQECASSADGCSRRACSCSNSDVSCSDTCTRDLNTDSQYPCPSLGDYSPPSQCTPSASQNTRFPFPDPESVGTPTPTRQYSNASDAGRDSEPRSPSTSKDRKHYMTSHSHSSGSSHHSHRSTR